MDKNAIKLQESANDGRSIFLFYDSMAGLYLAYGLSAYYTTLVTEPYMSYSDEMQMPVALLKRDHILTLRQSTTKVEHVQKNYYHFKMRNTLGKEGYDRWAQGMLSQHDSF